MIIVAAALILSRLIGAGGLEPSAPPGPTMKTLDEIPPTWSQKLPASERFVLVMDDEAVLDKETGLVWERAPSENEYMWATAINRPNRYVVVGGRMGWRLPTMQELTSSIDPTGDSLGLPTGHPFQVDVSEYPDFWSATLSAESTGIAWAVCLAPGLPLEDRFFGSSITTAVMRMWCVRGGEGIVARLLSP